MIRLFAFLGGDERRLGLADDGGLYDLTAALERAGDLHARDEIGLLRRGLFRPGPLRRLLDRGLPPLRGAVDFDLPVARPPKILALARNFAEHAREMGSPAPPEPVFFAKATSALLPHGAPIEIPADLLSRVDPEGELAAIVGARARDVPEARALDAVAGWTALNDVTARDLQKADRAEGRPWFRSKSFDTFCPVGPFWVPRDEVPDLEARRLETRVNGRPRQSARLGEMLHTPARVLSFLSRHVTLEPGDLVAFGTPAGVAPIAPLDRVEVEIEGISLLSNPVTRRKCAGSAPAHREALLEAAFEAVEKALPAGASLEALLLDVPRLLEATLPHVHGVRTRLLEGRAGSPAPAPASLGAALAVAVEARGRSVAEIRIESATGLDASDRAFLERVARGIADRVAADAR